LYKFDNLHCCNRVGRFSVLEFWKNTITCTYFINRAEQYNKILEERGIVTAKIHKLQSLSKHIKERRLILILSVSDNLRRTISMDDHQQEDADTPTAPVANGWFRGLFRRRSVDPSLPQNHRRIERRHSTTCNNNTTSLQHPPVNRSRSLDLVHDTKQQEYHQQQQQQGGYRRPIRRPSIPWEIENTNYINSNNKTDNLLDDSLRSNTDQSMVSEVTFMTYSDEKANIIKEEFFKRMNEYEISKKEELTYEEKKVLLQEISNNAEEMLQNRIKKQKKEKPKQRRISQESNIDWNTVDDSGTSRKDCPDMKEEEQLCVPKKKSLTESLTSIMTMKRRNSICSNDNDNNKVNETWPSIVCSPQDYLRTSSGGKKKKIGGRINEGFQEEPDEVAWQHWQKHDASHDQASSPQDRQHDDTASTRLNIDEMIELKLLLANQQATIDTLSTKLHNLEVKCNQYQLKSNEDESRIHKLEEENRTLSRQLSMYQERESAGLRKQQTIHEHGYYRSPSDQTGRRDSIVTASTMQSGSSASRTL